jgi:hypothetical protein
MRYPYIVVGEQNTQHAPLIDFNITMNSKKNMKKQDYNNYRKYYPLHHFIFYPLLAAAIFWTFNNSRKEPDNSTLWLGLTIVLLFIAFLSLMMRQHYGLKNQDRIARLELRLRYFQLTHKRLEEFENKLSMKQLLALRFASDEELPVLVQKAADENISPSEIKKFDQNTGCLITIGFKLCEALCDLCDNPLVLHEGYTEFHRDHTELHRELKGFNFNFFPPYFYPSSIMYL